MRLVLSGLPQLAEAIFRRYTPTARCHTIPSESRIHVSRQPESLFVETPELLLGIGYTLLSRQSIKPRCFLGSFRESAEAVLPKPTELNLRIGLTLLGREPVEAPRLIFIRRKSGSAILAKQSEAVSCLGVALLSRLAVEPRGAALVFWHPTATVLV
jgi:hypothetical protein